MRSTGLLVALLIAPIVLFADVVEKGKTTFSNDVAVAANMSVSSNLTAGTVTMGANPIVLGTNSMSMYGGVLNGTNGVYWTKNGTNYWLLFAP